MVRIVTFSPCVVFSTITNITMLLIHPTLLNIPCKLWFARLFFISQQLAQQLNEPVSRHFHNAPERLRRHAYHLTIALHPSRCPANRSLQGFVRFSATGATTRLTRLIAHPQCLH